jgi:RimJ/RimL family protein N-acetyltransferase
LSLRVPTGDDAQTWWQLFDDPAVMRFIGTGELRDRGWYERFVEKQQSLAAGTGLCLFSVVVSGRVAGFTGIQRWDHPWGPTGTPELGWRLGRDFWGHGYAANAARIALDLAREQRIRRVVAMIQDGNDASIAVARKLGMTPDAVLTSPDGPLVHQFALTLRT